MRVRYEDEMFEVEYAKIDDNNRVSIGRNVNDIMFEVYCEDKYAADTLFQCLSMDRCAVLIYYGEVKDLRPEANQFDFLIELTKEQSHELLKSMRDDHKIDFLLNV